MELNCHTLVQLTILPISTFISPIMNIVCSLSCCFSSGFRDLFKVYCPRKGEITVFCFKKLTSDNCPLPHESKIK